MTIETIRTELQISEAVIDNASINYAIAKIEIEDINLVCAEVLRMVLRKHRGLVRRTVGKYSEVIDPKEIRKEINNYMHKAASAVMDDNFEYPDSVFTKELP
jgi:hypothetical protein